MEYFSPDLQTGWIVAAHRVLTQTITVSYDFSTPALFFFRRLQQQQHQELDECRFNFTSPQWTFSFNSRQCIIQCSAAVPATVLFNEMVNLILSLFLLLLFLLLLDKRNEARHLICVPGAR